MSSCREQFKIFYYNTYKTCYTDTHKKAYRVIHQTHTDDCTLRPGTKGGLQLRVMPIGLNYTCVYNNVFYVLLTLEVILKYWTIIRTHNSVKYRQDALAIKYTETKSPVVNHKLKEICQMFTGHLDIWCHLWIAFCPFILQKAYYYYYFLLVQI